ncbi:WD40-repeat-containing domain protein, partial [Butyriboletus roseoflavus]
DQTTIVLDTGHSDRVWAVAFQPDGKYLLGGSINGIRRWQLADGQEVARQSEGTVRAISASSDHKWIVCGTTKGASVWDGEMHEEVINVERTNIVWAVDVSPESTRFTTGTDKDASIWSITSGKRLVGPLKHENYVMGVRFSPNGEQFATAHLGNSIHIYDSYTGDKLMTMKISILSRVGTPLAWSRDGQQIFAASHDNKIKSFDISTGSLLAESQALHDGDGDVASIAVAPNNPFIATFADRSISFLDTSTLTRIGPVIDDGERIRSISISADSSHIATGGYEGKIVIRDLAKIMPGLYGPFNASSREQMQDEQPLTSGDDDSKVPGSTPVGFRHFVTEIIALTPSLCMYDRKILWNPVELSPRNTAKTSMPLSPASSDHPWEDEIPPAGPSHALLQLSDSPSVTSSPEARAQENLHDVMSPHGRSIFKRWLQKQSKTDSASHKSDRLSGKSRQPDCRSPPHSSPRMNVTNEGSLRMAAAQRRPRTVATSWGRREVRCVSSLYVGNHHTLQNQSPTKTTGPKDPNKNASRSGQGSVGANEAGPVRVFR